MIKSKRDHLIEHFKSFKSETVLVEEVPCRTTKYKCLHVKRNDKDSYYFFGKNGAVRRSTNNSVTNSISVTSIYTKQLENKNNSSRNGANK